MTNYNFDKIILAPNDIDLSHSPLKEQLDAETYVLGAFNPGMTRLPDGNLLLMVRIAEALKKPENNGIISSIRWDIKRGYILDHYKLDQVDTSDPRKFIIKEFLPNPVLALTSISWLLPVELSGDGGKIINII